MTDTNTPTDAATAREGAPDPSEPAAKPEIDWRGKAREWEKRAKENSTAAQRLAELEESQKTEAQRLTDRVAQVERERDDTRVELTRFRLATRYGLAEEDLDFIGSGSDDEMEDRARRLADRVRAAEPTTGPGPRPDLSQGARSDSYALNDDQMLNDLKSKLGIR